MAKLYDVEIRCGSVIRDESRAVWRGRATKARAREIALGILEARDRDDDTAAIYLDGEYRDAVHWDDDRAETARFAEALASLTAEARRR